MAIKINENHDADRRIFRLLRKEEEQVSREIEQFLAEIPPSLLKELPTNISQKFNSVMQEWKGLRRSLRKEIKKCRLIGARAVDRSRQFRAQSEEKVLRKQHELSIKVKRIRSKQSRLGKSFTEISYLWEDSLVEMEKKLSTQKVKISSIEKSISKFDQQFVEEINGTLQSTFLEKQRKLLEKSPLDAEPIVPSKANEQIEPRVNISLASIHSYTETSELERLMREVDKNRSPRRQPSDNFSIEKSHGGWKSEYESEGESIMQISPHEIRSAIEILKKANLLSSQNRNLLGRLADVMKNPENSQGLEFIMQLANLNRNLVESPANARIFPQDFLSMNSNQAESPTVVLQGLQNPEPVELEESFSDIIEGSSQNLKDFHWEDLLNVPDFEADIKYNTSELVNDKPVIENNVSHDPCPMPKEFLQEFDYRSEARVSPQRKQASDYQSTGISSQTGLRSRITLKTAGSENSQKVFTPGSKGIEEAFRDM